jgi:preprotein translocase subunit SecA
MLGSSLKLDSVMKRVFGSSNDRRLKGYRPKVMAINALEPEFEALSDDELRARTAEFREGAAMIPSFIHATTSQGYASLSVGSAIGCRGSAGEIAISGPSAP